jgi:hypothetical protein
MPGFFNNRQPPGFVLAAGDILAPISLIRHPRPVWIGIYVIHEIASFIRQETPLAASGISRIDLRRFLWLTLRTGCENGCKKPATWFP